MNQNFLTWADTIDWESVGIVLLKFAVSMKNRRSWAGSEGRLPGGYTPNDVVQEVIIKYLVDHLPIASHNITEPELLKKLRNKIIDRYKDLSEWKSNVDGIVEISEAEGIFFTMELDPAFDISELEFHVLQYLENEPFLLGLFSALNEGETKENFINRMKITEQEYDNAIRRLRRRINPILTQLKITRQHARSSKKSDPSVERA